MKNATMLYKLGTEMKWEGVDYDTVIVGEDDIEEKLKEGWFRTAGEANADAESKGDADLDGNVTRKEMEIKAKELGIKFNHKTTNDSLLAKIEEAI
jgi:hypothetical protein